jgi:hypothetical protein
MADPVARPPSWLCEACLAEPKCTHPNAKYCHGCRAERRRRPRSTLTPEQGAQVARWIGVLSRKEIAQRLGVSRAAVGRYTRDHGLYGRSDAYTSAVVAAVCSAYETLGRRPTERLFPDVSIRSIVERYKQHRPRQIRWTGAQMIEAARMAGLVSATAQARYFGRPNAYAGSIRSVWAKRFQCAPMDVNGLGVQLAWWIATPGLPAVVVKHSAAGTCTPKVLWLDLVQHLRPDVPDWVRNAVQVLARFQAWLHGTDDPAAIRAMITQREASYGDADPSADERPRHREADATAGSV